MFSDSYIFVILAQKTQSNFNQNFPLGIPGWKNKIQNAGFGGQVLDRTNRLSILGHMVVDGWLTMNSGTGWTTKDIYLALFLVFWYQPQ